MIPRYEGGWWAAGPHDTTRHHVELVLNSSVLLTCGRAVPNLFTLRPAVRSDTTCPDCQTVVQTRRTGVV